MEDCIHDKTQRSTRLVDDCVKRLNKIEGQVKGLTEMVKNDRYCDDILAQVSSVQSALSGVSRLILDNHVRECIANRLKEGDDEAIDELIETLKRMKA
jgi:DNA-binding FrmR family transcriptional regulator